MALLQGTERSWTRTACKETQTDRKRTADCQRPRRAGSEEQPLTGAGFSLGVMNSFWNWLQVVNVQHDECTTCCWIGLLCYVNVTSIFVLRYISKTNKQKKHPPQKKPQTQKRTSTSKELFCHATQKSCLSYKHADAAVLTRKERRQNKKH